MEARLYEISNTPSPSMASETSHLSRSHLRGSLSGKELPPHSSTCALSHALLFFKRKNLLSQLPPWKQQLCGAGNASGSMGLVQTWKSAFLHCRVPGCQSPARSPLLCWAAPVKFLWVRSHTRQHQCKPPARECWGQRRSRQHF